MNRSNIIISIIVVLCIAAGVTAYELSHENNIFSGLSTFNPTGTEHTEDGLGNNTTTQQNDNTNTTTSSNQNGNNTNTSSANTQNNKVSQNQEPKSNNGNTVKTNKTVTQNIKNQTPKNKTPIIKNDTNKTPNDGWISESRAIEIAGGKENLVAIRRSGDMYIITYKMYVEKAGQFPEPGWYEVNIGISKSGENLGLV